MRRIMKSTLLGTLAMALGLGGFGCGGDTGTKEKSAPPKDIGAKGGMKAGYKGAAGAEADKDKENDKDKDKDKDKEKPKGEAKGKDKE